MDPSDRNARIQTVLDECLGRPEFGDSDRRSQLFDQIVAEHADLMPELGTKLRFLAMVRSAQSRSGLNDPNRTLRAAAEPATAQMAQTRSDDEPGTGDPKDRNRTLGVHSDTAGGLVVRCPNCQIEIYLKHDSDLGQVRCQACNSHFTMIADDETSGLKPGDMLGRFHLLRRIGQGGFGSVWQGVDPQLERMVAIKVPRRGDLTAVEAEMFLREARSAAQIRHPNIVAIHEVGLHEDRIYLVCDFINGQSLAQRLKSGAAFSIRESSELLYVIAQALGEVHRHNIIHRDLKPGNILLDVSGKPHLSDFGLARRTTGDISMTTDGLILGTPAYMSPEQASGKARDADGRSDIYSLGVIMFELLTRALPFRGLPQAILNQVLHSEPPALRKLNLMIPRDLETICLKCLEKSPERRYQTAGELASELERYLHGIPIQARPISRFSRTLRWGQRKPVAAALASLVFLLAIFAPIAAIYFRGMAFRERKSREAAQAAELKATSHAAAARRSEEDAKRSSLAAELAERQRSEQLYAARMKSVQTLMEKHNYVRAGELLKSLQPETGKPDLRDFEWYYWRAQSELGLVMEISGCGSLNTVAVSPDGRWLAFGGYAGMVNLIDVDEKKLRQIGPFEPNEGDRPINISSIAFHPGSKILAIGLGDPGKAVLLANVLEANVFDRLETQGQWIREVEFSKDGAQLVACTQNGTVETWTELAPDSHRVYQVMENSITRVALAGDGSFAATTGGIYGGQAQEFHLLKLDMGTVQKIDLLKLAKGNDALCSSKDDKLIFVGVETVSTIALVDLTTLQIQRRYETPDEWAIQDIALSPDGSRLVASGAHGQLAAWDVATREIEARWPGHSDRIMAVAFWPDGKRFASVSRDGCLRVWDCDVDSSSLFTRSSDASVVGFSSDGQDLFGIEESRTVRCWDARNRLLKWQAAIDPSREAMRIECASHGEALVLGERTGPVSWWNADSGERLETMAVHRPDHNIEALVISPDGKWLASCEGQWPPPPNTGELTEEILLWDVASRKVAARWPAHGRLIADLRFTSDSRQLFSLGWDKVIRRWDVETQKLLSEYRLGNEAADSLQLIDRQNVLCAMDSKGALYRWSLVDGRELPRLNFREGIVGMSALSPDESTLAVRVSSNYVDSSMIQLIDTRTWDEKTTFELPGVAVSLVYSPDGEHLAASDYRGNIYLWYAPRQSPVQRWVLDELKRSGL